MLARILPKRISDIIFHRLNFEKITELRLRADLPVIVGYGEKYLFLTELGVSDRKENALRISGDEIKQIVILASERSLYSVNNQLAQGYITIYGGVRIGICGEVVTDNGTVKTIKNFTALNVRFPRQILGCSLPIYDFVVQNNSVKNTLIISPPGAGKTTVLRDLCRVISNETKRNILLVDERRELSASDKTKSAFDIGNTVDVLTNCTKDFAFSVGVRSMRPDVIITDELTCENDYRAVCEAIEGGVSVIASIHGDELKRLLRRDGFDKMMEQSVIQRLVFYSARNGPGTLEKVFDENLNCIYQAS